MEIVSDNCKIEQESMEEQENIIVIDDTNSEDCLIDSKLNEEIVQNHTENIIENQIHKNLVLEEAPIIIKNTIKQLIVDRVTKEIEAQVISDENAIKEEYNRYLESKKRKLNDYVSDLQQKIDSDTNTISTIKSSLQQSNGLIQFLNKQIDSIETRKNGNKNRLETIKIKIVNQQNQFETIQQEIANKRNYIVNNYEELKNSHTEEINKNREKLENLKRELKNISEDINNFKEEIERVDKSIAERLEEKQNIEENLLRTKNDLAESCLQQENELQLQNKTITDLKNQIEAYKNKLQSLAIEIQQITDIGDRYKNEIETLEKNIDSLFEDYQNKQDNINKARIALKNIDDEAMNNGIEFNQRFQEKENELEVLISELAACKDLQAKRSEEIEALRKALDEKLHIKDSLSKDIEIHQITINTHKETVNHLKNEQVTKQQILQDLQDKSNGLKQTLENWRVLIQEQTFEIEKIDKLDNQLESVDKEKFIVTLENKQEAEHLKSKHLQTELQENLEILTTIEQTIDELTKENNETKLQIQSKIFDLNELRSFVKKLMKNRHLTTSLSRSFAESEVSQPKKVHFNEIVLIKSGTDDSDSQNLSQSQIKNVSDNQISGPK